MLVIGSLGSTWLSGICGYWLEFPQPWLIPLRIVSFVGPVIVAYPIAQWLARAQRQEWVGKWLTPIANRAAVAYCGLLVFGEISAGGNNASYYDITDRMDQFHTTVSAVGSTTAVILTDDLRLAAWLVCETDHSSFIGYGGSSNASNREMVERLMIPSIIQGRSFVDFYSGQYLGANGLIWGPSGEHWMLHHGSVALHDEFSDHASRNSVRRTCGYAPGKVATSLPI